MRYRPRSRPEAEVTKDNLLSALYAVNRWALIPETSGGPDREDFEDAQDASDALARELERRGTKMVPRRMDLERGPVVLWFPKDPPIPGYRPN